LVLVAVVGVSTMRIILAVYCWVGLPIIHRLITQKGSASEHKTPITELTNVADIKDLFVYIVILSNFEAIIIIIIIIIFTLIACSVDSLRNLTS